MLINRVASASATAEVAAEAAAAIQATTLERTTGTHSKAGMSLWTVAQNSLRGLDRHIGNGSGGGSNYNSSSSRGSLERTGMNKEASISGDDAGRPTAAGTGAVAVVMTTIGLDRPAETTEICAIIGVTAEAMTVEAITATAVGSREVTAGTMLSMVTMVGEMIERTARADMTAGSETWVAPATSPMISG